MKSTGPLVRRKLSNSKKYRLKSACADCADRFESTLFADQSNPLVTEHKDLVRPANGFVTEGKRKKKKHAEFGYPVKKFISSDARDSSDRFVERINHIMTVYQTGVSVRFVRWKVLNMLKT